MKKYSWLIALFAVFAFVFAGFVSCKGDGNNNNAGTVVEITFDCQEGYFPSTGLGFKRVKTCSRGLIELPGEVVLERFKFREWNTSANGHGGTVLTSTTVHSVNTAYFAIWDQDTFYEEDLQDYSSTPPVVDGSFNTWNIEGEDLQALKDAEPGSMLRLHFDATGGPGANRSGWGVGIIGNGGNNVMDFIPLTAPSGAGFIYFIDVENNWLLDILELCDVGDKLVVATHLANRDMLQRTQLLEPKEERIIGARPGPPALPAATPSPVDGATFISNIAIEYGLTGDITTGKGYIAGEQLQLIRDTVAGLDADERVLMRIWIRNTPGAPGDQARDTSSWTDCGTIGGSYNEGGLGIAGGPINADRGHIYDDAAVRHLLGLNRDLFLNPYNGNVITLIELFVVPYRSLTVTVGGTAVKDILVNAVGGSVSYLNDSTGYVFTKTSNHRGGYAWFELDLAPKKLSDFKEIKFDINVSTTGTTGNDTSRRIALIARATAFTGSLGDHATGGSATQDQGVGSNHGWLAAGQVTQAMASSIANADLPQTVTLDIVQSVAGFVLPDAYTPNPITDAGAAAALGASKVFLSIYEHANAATITVSNIQLIER
jgi:hypothetical protein